MTFKQFQALAHVVFPDLPTEFDSIPDGKEAYDYLIPWLECDTGIENRFGLTNMERVNLFSLNNIVDTQIRHLEVFGKTFWD